VVFSVNLTGTIAGACYLYPLQVSDLNRSLDRWLSLSRKDRSVEQLLATGIGSLGSRVDAHPEKKEKQR
jgi:hypothetical protein